MPYSLVLAKETFKFSSSHFTLFGATHAEHLHGHNYTVKVRTDWADIHPDTEMAVDFNVIKKEIKKICDSLDEKILIPQNSPYLKIQKSPHYKDHTEVRFQKRVYCFPDDEICFLPVSNITSEALARFFHEQISEVIKIDGLKKVSVAVKETAGQSAIYY